VASAKQFISQRTRERAKRAIDGAKLAVAGTPTTREAELAASETRLLAREQELLSRDDTLRRREGHLLKEIEVQRDRYLQLLLSCIIGTIYRDPPLLGDKTFNAEVREYGWDWPSSAHSMIGRKRMQNVRELVESVIGNNIPGDLIETGVWRGGACIFMRGILRTYGVTDRKVWLADSFVGLPKPDESTFPADKGDTFHTYEELAVSLADVRANFERYGLLDEQVCFLEGWFKDTLPTAPIERLAILRLDGDMYESTMEALTPLYPKLSRGGFVIVDDYHVVPACKQAVHDFRDANGITDPIREIDNVGVFWQRSS
jgi:O-methyltransferase